MELVQFAVILGCATLIFGQSFPRKCSEIETMENFDISKFTGLWYEISARMNIVGGSGQCASIRYSYLGNNTLEIKNRVCFVNNHVAITGNLEPVDVTKGQFNLYYPGVSIAEEPYWVLATDYSNYSVIGMCTENQLIAVAIYARSTKLEGASKDAVNAVLKNMTGENLDNIFHSKHENCCYDPTAE